MGQSPPEPRQKHLVAEAEPEAEEPAQEETEPEEVPVESSSSRRTPAAEAPVAATPTTEVPEEDLARICRRRCPEPAEAEGQLQLPKLKLQRA